MENFTYCNPTLIEFGKAKEKELAQHIQSHGIKKVLIVYGSERIKKEGLFDVVIKQLVKKEIDFVEFGGIVSNPVLSSVHKAIEIVKNNQIDGIVSVGGGSVLDSSKAIAAGALYGGDVWDFFTRKATIERALPIFSIMTLAATGSEMNCLAVVTNEQTKEKYSIAAPSVYPKVSIINPELQMGVPKDYLVYSAADVIAHCIEAYFTSNNHPMLINLQTEAIIKTVIQTTETLLQNPQDYDARAEFAWAATNALNGSTLLGISGFSFPNHMIEHVLSALYNVPHGAGLSVVMPAWMKWYYPNNETQFQRFAKEIFGLESAIEGIEALEKWFEKIGTPTKLSQFRLDSSHFDEIIEVGLKNASFFGIPQYDKEVFEAILKNAL